MTASSRGAVRVDETPLVSTESPAVRLHQRPHFHWNALCEVPDMRNSIWLALRAVARLIARAQEIDCSASPTRVRPGRDERA